jgi:hypothetical protein
MGRVCSTMEDKRNAYSTYFGGEAKRKETTRKTETS